ncbi:MAG: GNAT family N-acetyltransferase [bacterium]|nr:GNAT family N-acetyltransferase [bacterium]
MQPITLRPVIQTDLPLLADLWYEKLTILAAADARLQPAPGARETWLTAAERWSADESCCFVTAIVDNRPVGYALGTLIPPLPGVSEARTGAVTQIAIDAHGYYGGAARMLTDGLRAWFHEHQAERVLVIAPHRYPAEQAFWRGLGAVDWMDLLWLKS